MVTVIQGEPDVLDRSRGKDGSDAWFVNIFAGQQSGRIRLIVSAGASGLVWASYATSPSWRRAVQAFRESGDEPGSLGRKGMAIPWGSVRTVERTPAYRLVQVTYRGPLGYPASKDLRSAASDAIFEAIRDRVGRDLPVEMGKARPDKIPLGPNQAGAVILFFFCVVSLIVGATYGADANPAAPAAAGKGLILFSARLGEWVGPIVSIALAAIAAAAGVALLARAIRGRPDRQIVRVPDRAARELESGIPPTG